MHIVQDVKDQKYSYIYQMLDVRVTPVRHSNGSYGSKGHSNNY